MPRLSRIVLPDRPHHIIQRGHNKQTVFLSDDDYGYYLENLNDWKQTLGCKIYAYCLMTNHVHLIIDPGPKVSNLALLMKRVSGRQTRYVNRRHQRTGTLWEGRYKSSPIETDTYLLACCRYIELNPVRAHLVSRPEQYRWSSYPSKIGLAEWRGLDQDPCYEALAPTPSERTVLYAKWVNDDVPTEEWERIRAAVQRGQLTGSDRFVSEVVKHVGRRIEWRGWGRPRQDRQAEK